MFYQLFEQTDGTGKDRIWIPMLLDTVKDTPSQESKKSGSVVKHLSKCFSKSRCHRTLIRLKAAKSWKTFSFKFQRWI